MVATLFGLILLQQSQNAVTLARVFTPHEKMAYEVQSHVTLENRARGMETFLPEDYDMKYGFTAEVAEMKTDGIAVLHYRRPTVTEIEGETYQSAPVSKVTKVNYDYSLTVSPINEILEMTKLSAETDRSSKKPAMWAGQAQDEQDQLLQEQVGQFITEMYRLALFNGPIESSLDFSPKLPFFDVVPGDSWKRTAGYQPQALKGKKGTTPVVQRLDYTYTYRGLVNSDGKTFQRVTADLNLNTDLAGWANQYNTGENGQDGVKLAKMPMHLKATIEFDLDPKTFDTIAARAYSQGGFSVYLADDPDNAYFESRLKGSTTLSLRSISR